jgi:hypothetical protein
MLFFIDAPFEFYWMLVVENYTWITRLLNLVHILVSGQKLTTLHQKTGRYPFPETFCKTQITLI